MDQAESLDGICPAIGQSHFTLIDVFMGAVLFIAGETVGPDVVFIAKSREKQPPLGQLHLHIRGQVVVDLGRIILKLRLVTSPYNHFGQAFLLLQPPNQLNLPDSQVRRDNGKTVCS
jgi:hypothetical protein